MRAISDRSGRPAKRARLVGSRRPLLLVAVTWLAVLGPATGASASTWAVSFSGSAGGAPVQVGFQVELGDPTGGVTVVVGDVPITVSHTADTFSVLVSVSWAAPGCGVTLTVSGSAPVRATADGPLAAGTFAGARVQPCTGESPITGTFTASDITGTANATLESSAGTVNFSSPFGPRSIALGGVVPPGLEVQTGADGRVTLAFQDGARMIVNPNSRIVLSSPPPPATADGNITIVAGQIDFGTGRPGSARVFGTATARVRDVGTDFSIRFSHPGVAASTLVTVRSGVVEVTNRRGQLTTLAAGQEAAFDDQVPRVLLILPADQASLVTGRANTFTWTAFAGALGYLVEFTLNPGGFATPNSATVESPSTTLRVPAGSFTEADGVVTFPFAVPVGVVAPGTRVQYRVFVADAGGGVLPNTISSNANTLVIQ